MILAEKLQEINEKFIQWVGIYRRKELMSNPARIVGEAICKAIILNLVRNPRGTAIIEGNDRAIPSGSSSRQIGEILTFSQLIQAVLDLRGFRSAKKMKTHLQFIQGLTNPGSHSANNPIDIVELKDMDLIYGSLSQLITWLYKSHLNQPLPEVIQDAMAAHVDSSEIGTDEMAWTTFLSACHDFSGRRQFILVSPPNLTNQADAAAAIARLPWKLVLDFNPNTDTEPTGLLTNFITEKGASYKRSFTIEDKIEFDQKFEHYWFHANGLGTVPTLTTFKDWRYKYKTFLGSKLYSAFDKGYRALPRTVVFINIEPDYAESIIEAFDSNGESKIDFVLTNNGNFKYERIISNFDHVTELHISVAQLAKSISNDISFSGIKDSENNIKIPYKNELQSSAFATMKQEDYDFLKSLGIEFIYKGVDSDIDSDLPLDDFYKGATITWPDLASQKDIIRYSYDGIKRGLLTELEKNKSKEIEFIHEPGAGGTTMARRLAYDICDKYPTVCLRRYDSRKTLNGLRIIYDSYTNSSVPLLIIIEHYEVKSAHLLYRDLGNVGKNAILFIVKRAKINSARDLRYTLRASLQTPEISSFEGVFSHQMPLRKQAISDIKRNFASNSRFISPFLYGLVTYERDFKGVDDYVAKCIEDLNVQKRKLIGFICLIYHFTQQAVPGEFFSDLFNTSWEKCDLYTLLGEDSPVFDLLYENMDDDEGENIWRPRYAILGEETMKIVLAGSPTNKQNWKAHLSQWLIDLIGHISRAVPVLNDDVKDLFDALFITRGDYDNADGRDQFTDAIRELEPTAGQAVFEALTAAYPDEAHYHGHYARYLYKPEKGLRLYDRAIEEAVRSLEIQDYDPSLVHTLGMCYKEKAENKINELPTSPIDPDLLEDEVKQLVELACETFDRSIALDGDNVFGHVTQIQLILKTLDFGYKISGSTSRELFVTDPQNDWYEALLEKAGGLLEEAIYIIEQSKGLDIKARLKKSVEYIKRCEVEYLIKIGEVGVAQRKYENLIKQTPANYQYMVSRYKTLFIRCLLASKSNTISGYANAWDKLSESQLLQCIEYLRENIFADPMNSSHVRMWLQAVRHLKHPPSLEEAISMVAMWSQIENQTRNSKLESLYYLYVLNAVKAICAGSNFDKSSVNSVLELRDRLRGFSKNEKFSFEWYGSGIGLHKIKNHRVLGSFDPTTFFTLNADNLAEAYGRIKEASDWQRGKIILDCGLEAFFVPGIGTFSQNNENQRVKFYIGFRYDQINAWDVVPADYVRTTTIGEEEQSIETEEDDDLFKNIKKPEKVISTPYTTSLKTELPQLKVVGSVILPESKRPATKLSPVQETNQLTPDSQYIGTIDRLKQPVGIIKSLEVGQYVTFHASALRNIKFNKLKYGRNVTFRIKFENGVPKKDRSGKYIVASDVYESQV